MARDGPEAIRQAVGLARRRALLETAPIEDRHGRLRLGHSNPEVAAWKIGAVDRVSRSLPARRLALKTDEGRKRDPREQRSFSAQMARLDSLRQCFFDSIAPSGGCYVVAGPTRTTNDVVISN
jgi:hypothetical protein